MSVASRSSARTEIPRPWLAAPRRAAKRFLEDDCLGLAQEIAYSSLLAFFPAAIFLVGLLGLVGAYDALKSFLDPITPHAVGSVLDTLRRESSGTGAGLAALTLGGAGAVWAASGAAGTVIKAVNRAQRIEERRPFWKLRLVAVLLVVSSAVGGLGALLLIVVGAPIGRAIADRAGLGRAFDVTWGILRWPAAFCVLLTFFALVYYLAPARRRHWRWISPGSLVGSLLWLALSGLFALYTAFAGSYGKTYGALASGIVLLLWLNYSALALLYGAELNQALEEEAG